MLDFFGGMFEIRDGKALVPGAPRSAAAWTELAGVSPDQGAAFFEKLIAKDDGWLASYYDALARINGPVRDYLTDPARMQRFYQAIRGKVTSPGPARPVFRANADMMLLTTRLWIEPDGQPARPRQSTGMEGLCSPFIRKASTTPSSRARPSPGKTPMTCSKPCSGSPANPSKTSR